MILAGVLLKLGGYGIIRIAYPICPWAAYELAAWVAGFGVFKHPSTGAFAAMAPDRLQEARRLLVGEPHGLRPAGIAGVEFGGDSNAWSLGMNARCSR